MEVVHDEKRRTVIFFVDDTHQVDDLLEDDENDDQWPELAQGPHSGKHNEDDCVEDQEGWN